MNATHYSLEAQRIEDHKSLQAVAKTCGIKISGLRSKNEAYETKSELARVCNISVRVSGYIPDAD